MSETTRSHEEQPTLLGIQFKDGRMGNGTITPGDKFTFDTKWAKPDARTTTVLIKTENGDRYAVGAGVMIKLPELDESTGKFGESGEKVAAIRLADIPAGVQDITIGESWSTLGSEDKVSLAMYDYKAGEPDPRYYQVEAPNPFDSASEHLQRVSDTMNA